MNVLKVRPVALAMFCACLSVPVAGQLRQQSFLSEKWDFRLDRDEAEDVWGASGRASHVECDRWYVARLLQGRRHVPLHLVRFARDDEKTYLFCVSRRRAKRRK